MYAKLQKKKETSIDIIPYFQDTYRIIWSTNFRAETNMYD